MVVKAPKCKICGNEHWTYQEHVYERSPGDVAAAVIKPLREASAKIVERSVVNGARVTTLELEGAGTVTTIENRVPKPGVPLTTRPSRSRLPTAGADDDKAVVAKPPRGRPSTTGKPWEASGISRAEWYRRKKTGGDK